jgi:hypothetical protein
MKRYNTSTTPVLLTHLIRARTYMQLAETLLTVPGLVDASTGRMRGRLIPSQFESRKASELKTDEYNLGEHYASVIVCNIFHRNFRETS